MWKFWSRKSRTLDEAASDFSKLYSTMAPLATPPDMLMLVTWGGGHVLTFKGKRPYYYWDGTLLCFKDDTPESLVAIQGSLVESISFTKT